ncbi:hypothetical protein BpHYR1_044523 [Brachionus plicatilis]|uniref:Uncharacterized protein n=1 Tax=Brachionus plicatilis TaxID=10195 RepID=A0A3M7SZI8_BRAPC|nr:hypothetical protein BpHYR1_044523 [Brachionus plicatilis]
MFICTELNKIALKRSCYYYRANLILIKVERPVRSLNHNRFFAYSSSILKDSFEKKLLDSVPNPRNKN